MCMSDSVQLPETLMSMVDNSTQTTITANFILQYAPVQTISMSLLLQFYRTMILQSDFRTERIRSGVKDVLRGRRLLMLLLLFLLNNWSPVIGLNSTKRYVLKYFYRTAGDRLLWLKTQCHSKLDDTTRIFYSDK